MMRGGWAARECQTSASPGVTGAEGMTMEYESSVETPQSVESEVRAKVSAWTRQRPHPVFDRSRVDLIALLAAASKRVAVIRETAERACGRAIEGVRRREWSVVDSARAAIWNALTQGRSRTVLNPDEIVDSARTAALIAICARSGRRPWFAVGPTMRYPDGHREMTAAGKAALDLLTRAERDAEQSIRQAGRDTRDVLIALESD